VVEYCEEDAVHRRAVGKDAHWSGSPSDFANAPFDGVGGPDLFALSEGFLAPASQQIIEVVTQGSERFWIILLPAGSEALGGRTGLRHGLGVHDGLKIGFDRGLVSDAHLGQEVADLMRPAALQQYAGISGQQPCQQTRAVIDTDDLEILAVEAAADQVAENALPFGGTFALRQAESR
jgi:hypothetical protein